MKDFQLAVSTPYKNIDFNSPGLKAAIRDKYDAYSTRYDLLPDILEILGIRGMRRRLLHHAGLSLEDHGRFFGGVFRWLVATPNPD